MTAPKTIPAPKLEPAVPMRNRVIRCDDELWEDAMAQAAEDGIPLSAVVRFYLHSYGARKRKHRATTARKKEPRRPKP